MDKVIAYSTVAMTVGCAVTRPRIGGTWRIGPAQAALFGVTVMLLGGIVQLGEVVEAAAELWRAFATIVAIMVMTAVASRLGVLQGIAGTLFGRAEPSPSALFARVFLMSAITSSVLNNDAMVLLLTPVVVGLVKSRYPRQPHLVVPFAFAVFSAVGVAPLVISNPMNMIVAEYADIGFNEYATIMAPIAVAGWVVAFAVVRAFFHRSLTRSVEPAPSATGEPFSRVQWALLALVGGAVCAYPVVTLVDDSLVWVVATAGALGAVLLAWVGAGVGPVQTVGRGVAWNVMLFLFAVFVVAMGLRNVGFVDGLASLYDGARLGLIGGVASVGSAFLNNHPMAILNMMALETLEGADRLDILAVLIGGDLGPRLLPIGSLAGLLWLDALRRQRVRIPLRLFVTVGVLVTVPTLVISLLLLGLH